MLSRFYNARNRKRYFLGVGESKKRIDEGRGWILGEADWTFDFLLRNLISNRIVDILTVGVNDVRNENGNSLHNISILLCFSIVNV